MHKVTNELRIVKIEEETANVYESEIRSQRNGKARVYSAPL